MISDEFDVIIVGAGPSGCSCALMLAHSGLRIAIIDKAKFPRHKICGDALSGNVMNVLKRLPDNIYEKFLNDFNEKYPSSGIRFIGPNLKHLDISFSEENDISSGPKGYISKRINFDTFLFNQLNSYPNIKKFEDCKIEEVIITDNGVVAKSNNTEFQGKIIIGADGANSIVAKRLSDIKFSRRNNCTGLRAYYKNVSGFENDNYIELFFLKEVLPGYFWIFHLPDNTANVGIGMLNSYISKKKINLKKLMSEIINGHPGVSPRFKNAILKDDVKAYSLPMSNGKMKLSGHRYILTGDAASLVEPFTGEGVGNAMLSGKFAAEQIIECFLKNDFSSSFIKLYDENLYGKISDELRISRTLQKLSRYPVLLNLFINKANKNEVLHNMLTLMIRNTSVKNELTKPSFYFKLLFDR